MHTYTPDELDTWDHDRLVDQLLRIQDELTAKDRKIEKLTRGGDRIMGSIMADGGLVDELLEERDQARAELERIKAFVNRLEGAAFGNKMAAMVAFYSCLNSVNARFEQRTDKPRSIQYAEDAIYWTVKELDELLATWPEPDTWLEQAIYHALQNIAESHPYRQGVGFLRAAEKDDLPPPFGAYELLQQWEQDGTVDDDRLHRLYRVWGDCPKPATLAEALRVVWLYEHRPNEQTDAAFCGFQHVERRTLTNYKQHVTELRAFAALPDDHQRLFEG